MRLSALLCLSASALALPVPSAYAQSFEDLGNLAGASNYSSVTGVSRDGTVVVGLSTGPSGDEAFRWTSGGGMVGLGDLAGGSFYSYAFGTNADGSVVVGYGTNAVGYEAFRWTSGGGMVGLGYLPGGSTYSGASATSADGSVIVGRSDGVNGFEAYRWTQATGMVGLGDLAGGGFDSDAVAVNADGSVIVGQAESANGYEAFRWTQATGMESLSTLLTDAGVDLTGYTLDDAYGVDDSGEIIVGDGSLAGDTIGYIANVATGGVTTPQNLEAGLAAGIIPVQQVQSAASNNLGQSLFAATQSFVLFDHNALSVFDSNMAPSLISPAAGDDDDIKPLARRWSAYAVGSFGFGQNNDTDNTSLNGTTGLMAKVNDDWIVGFGIIGSHNTSDMTYDGKSKLNAMGGSVVTSYEGGSGLRLYGSAFAAHLDVDTERHYMNGAGIDASRGSTGGMGYGAAARAGWEFAASGVRIMPYGEAQMTKTQLDSYTETGGAFPATYGRSNGSQVTTKLGTQVGYDVTPSITLATRLAWAHRLREDDGGITASSTGFTGTLGNPSGDRNWGELSLEGGWQATPDTHVSIELGGRSGRTQEPVGSITLGVSTRF